MFQLNVDILISDTRGLMPIQDAMTRPLESVLRAFGEAINTQLMEHEQCLLEREETLASITQELLDNPNIPESIKQRLRSESDTETDDDGA